MLFFFGRPGHRDDKAAAPDVSFNQQPVTDARGDQPLTLPSDAPVASNNVATSPVGNDTGATAPELNVQNNAPTAEVSPQPPVAPTTTGSQNQSTAVAIQPAPVVPAQPAPQPAPAPRPAPAAPVATPSKPAPAQPARKAEKPAPEAKPAKLASSDPIMNAAQRSDARPAPAAKPAAAPAVAPAATATASTPTDGWSVQAGSFGNTDNAQRLVQRLAQNGFKAYTLKRDPNTVVLVGPFSTSQAAEEARTQMQQRAATNGLVVRNGKH